MPKQLKPVLIVLLLIGCKLSLAQGYSDHYLKLKAFYEAQPDTENEVIFLGNSITEGGDFNALFPNNNVINRGISGDVTHGILNRIEEITSSKPKQVFLMIGTNDLARGKSIDEVVEGIDQIIRRIKADSEQTQIILQSILPINPNVGNRFLGHKSNHFKIIKTNDRLKALAHSHSIRYVDLHKAMRNKDQHIKAKYTYDGLHLSKKGYKRWKHIIKHLILKN